MRSEVLQVEFDKGRIREQHIRDAENADDCPSDELHSTTVETGTITVEATPEAMRWFYDYLQYLVRAWRQEGEQWDADVADEMASTVWEEHGSDLPDQQRNRRIIG